MKIKKRKCDIFDNICSKIIIYIYLISLLQRTSLLKNYAESYLRNNFKSMKCQS